jgi:hypothetical protein
MDAFLAKADLNEMAKFLTFCGEVTAEKLGERKQRKQHGEFSVESVNCDERQTTGSSKFGLTYREQVIQKCLKSTKLGFKQTFAHKKTVERTTSTGTISSTDTGYQSIDSDCERLSKTSDSSIGEHKYHTPILTNIADVPRHSTPIIAVRTQKRRADDFDTTFNADNSLVFKNLKQMNEIQGKSMILQKFMADQTLPVAAEHFGNKDYNSPDVKRRRMERYSMPAFRSQEDVCRFLWDNNCDSDSECESDMSEPCEDLDVAFNAGQTTESQSRTLRRESAISNLNRFSLLSRDFDVNARDSSSSQTRTLRRESAISNLNQFSLLSRDIGLDTFDESSGFDYSFDCSFPRMDETKSEDFSMDFSYDYDESDSESEALCNEDDCMDSFMKTKSFIDVSGDATVCDV